MRVGLLLLALVIPATAIPADRTFAEEDARIVQAAGQTGQGPILLRIGLVPDRKILLSSSGPFQVLDVATLKPVWRPSYAGELAVVLEGGPEGEVRKVFRIQVGAFASEQAAEKERSRLSGLYGVPGVVHYVPDRGSYRVRIGEASSRDALSPLLDRMRAAGLSGLWIADEPGETVAGGTLRLVDTGNYQSEDSGLVRLLAVPAGGKAVRVGGVAYRGVVELRIDRYARIRPVNWVELENYLQGVVPAELGPEVWPEIEALKAQAVAARTYVIRNLGQFHEDGYDLCATPRCQVYKGLPAEHPLSDRAIRATRGEILRYDGKPISAMYTATCGGHTEDAVEIFPEEDAPYLKGVPCSAEYDARESHSGTVAGRNVEPLLSGAGGDLTRDWALLAAAGVLSWSGAEAAAGPFTPSDLEGSATALAALTGRSRSAVTRETFKTLGETAEEMVRALGWEERPRVLLEGRDLEAVLRDPATDDLPESQRRALAYLALTGGLAPFSDGRYRVGRPPSRGRVVPALVRIGEAYDAFGLKSGTLAAVDGLRLRLVRGKGEVRLHLSDTPFLFGYGGGRVVSVAELELWPGDKVRYRTGPDGRIDFLELVPPVTGVSDDRSSSMYSWEVRRSRREVEKAINRRVVIGTLTDLRAVRRGVSGRIVELEVRGSRASTVVKGFDLRNLLGLRESLAVIEIQRGPGGGVESVVFAGKGWGHGVGLCQVGAYGMALRGETYRAILAHYYRGAVLGKI